MKIVNYAGALVEDVYTHYTFPLFLSHEGGNRWIIDETSGFYGIFQIFAEDLPKPS